MRNLFVSFKLLSLFLVVVSTKNQIVHFVREFWNIYVFIKKTHTHTHTHTHIIYKIYITTNK